MPLVNTRKGHTKSRTGCRTCKKRKIKCDETKPECRNCVRFGVYCEFSPNPAYIIRPRGTDSGHQEVTGNGSLRGPGRPRADWAAWTGQRQQHRHSAITTTAATTSPSEASSHQSHHNGIASSLQPLNVEDLHLFHHYCTTVAATFGNVSIWRDNVPRLGSEYPCIYHGMMALAAQHLAAHRDAKTPKYLRLADLHFEAAIQGATQLFPGLSLDTCQPLFVVSALICLTSMAQGPAVGELLLVSKGGRVPFYSLFRGLRMVLGTIGQGVVFSGLLHSGEDSQWFTPTEPQPGTARLSSDELAEWETSLCRLSDLIRSSSPGPSRREMYLAQVAELAKLSQSAFGTALEVRPLQHGDIHQTMRWVFFVEDDLVDALEAGEPIALLILGHFSLMIRSLEYYWFMHGWSAHLLREVKQMLGEQWVGWLP